MPAKAMQLYSQGLQRPEVEPTFEAVTIAPSLHVLRARSKSFVKATLADALPSAGAGAIIAVLIVALGVMLALAAANAA